MRLQIDVDLDYHFPKAADVLLTLEVAQLPDQVLIEDLLTVERLRAAAPDHRRGRDRPAHLGGDRGPVPRPLHRDRRCRARARRRSTASPTDPLDELPAEVVPYLWPSRYCEADSSRPSSRARSAGSRAAP